MNGLPIALTNPEGGKYSVETAVSIWLHVAYGFPYGVPNGSRDYKIARRDAAADLNHLVKSEEGPPRGPVIRRRRSTWLDGTTLLRNGYTEPNQVPVATVDNGPKLNRWIYQADLIRFAAERGVELFPETAAARVSESEPIKAKPGAPIKIPDEAIDLVRQLYTSREARTKKEAGMMAAERFGLDPLVQGKTLETYIGRERKKPTQ
ncbi:hypothetical protein [Thiocapsa bogorovii]|uniref:hypothetical protein n=1 Tax=Thiocapsa bogorovii TaxID=521689 RepID=UPI001E5BFFEC|nr:hypothetical protein [Thiocapsa bogorovii]UHD15731.1 hypothetical protein LT988_21120 [Thiocapsa bogorovii]